MGIVLVAAQLLEDVAQDPARSRQQMKSFDRNDVMRRIAPSRMVPPKLRFKLRWARLPGSDPA
jgi:hypothetical protein